MNKTYLWCIDETYNLLVVYNLKRKVQDVWISRGVEKKLWIKVMAGETDVSLWTRLPLVTTSRVIPESLDGMYK